MILRASARVVTAGAAAGGGGEPWCGPVALSTWRLHCTYTPLDLFPYDEAGGYRESTYLPRHTHRYRHTDIYRQVSRYTHIPTLRLFFGERGESSVSLAPPVGFLPVSFCVCLVILGFASLRLQSQLLLLSFSSVSPSSVSVFSFLLPSQLSPRLPLSSGRAGRDLHACRSVASCTSRHNEVKPRPSLYAPSLSRSLALSLYLFMSTCPDLSVDV